MPAAPARLAQTGLLLVLTAAAAHAQASATYVIEARGPAGAVLSGTCRLMAAAGERVVELARPLPLRLEFVGHGLACDLTGSGAGMTTVEVRRDGAVRSSMAVGGQGRIAFTVQ